MKNQYIEVELVYYGQVSRVPLARVRGRARLTAAQVVVESAGEVEQLKENGAIRFGDLPKRYCRQTGRILGCGSLWRLASEGAWRIAKASKTGVE